MRIRSHIGLFFLAALLTACVYPYDIRPDDGPVLSLVVEFPEDMGTKASTGEQSAQAYENIIKSLRIWVFNHDAQDHPLIVSKTIAATDFPSGENIRHYALQVSHSFAENPPNVDIFVLANADAAGCTLKTEQDNATCSSYAEVSGALLQDNEQEPYKGFGTVHPVRSVSEEIGLPMSGCLINQSVGGKDPQLTVPTVTMTRTVSRIRFVFCKAPSTTDIRITNITLVNGQTISSTWTGGLIAAQEYLFLTNGGATNLNGYVTSDFSYFTSQNTSGAEIATHPNPEQLIYGQQAPETYEQLIQNALNASVLTALPSKPDQFTYLRESDKQLTGTITYVVYKAGGWETKTKTFVMADSGDFARNRSWTVFAYFQPDSYDMRLQFTVTPWTGYQTSDINNSHL